MIDTKVVIIGNNKEYDYAFRHLFPKLSKFVDYFFVSKTFGFILLFNRIDAETKKLIGISVCKQKNKVYNFFGYNIVKKVVAQDNVRS